MDNAQAEKWVVDYADVEPQVEALGTINRAFPRASKVIVDLLDDEDASHRLRFEAAKYVMDKGLTKESTEEPWKHVLDTIAADTEQPALVEAPVFMDDPEFDGDV